MNLKPLEIAAQVTIKGLAAALQELDYSEPAAFDMALAYAEELVTSIEKVKRAVSDEEDRIADLEWEAYQRKNRTIQEAWTAIVDGE